MGTSRRSKGHTVSKGEAQKLRVYPFWGQRPYAQIHLLCSQYNSCNAAEWRMVMLEYKFDTQLLIEGNGLSEDKINEYFVKHFEGDCLLAVGDEDLIKIHFHTNTPWRVLEYCASLGDIHDIVIENMQRQENGLKG